MLKQLKNNRKSIICDKALYEESDKEIKLLVPTGLERYDGKEQLFSLENALDVSKHQRTKAAFF